LLRRPRLQVAAILEELGLALGDDLLALAGDQQVLVQRRAERRDAEDAGDVCAAAVAGAGVGLLQLGTHAAALRLPRADLARALSLSSAAARSSIAASTFPPLLRADTTASAASRSPRFASRSASAFAAASRRCRSSST